MSNLNELTEHKTDQIITVNDDNKFWHGRWCNSSVQSTLQTSVTISQTAATIHILDIFYIHCTLFMHVGFTGNSGLEPTPVGSVPILTTQSSPVVMQKYNQWNSYSNIAW